MCFLFSFYFFAAFCLINRVLALPHRRIVVSPHIFNPDENTIWTAGQTATINWDTSDIPLDNLIGKVVLGYQADNSEHLMLDSPLAQDFPLIIGQVNITVPDVVTRSDYIIVLFGDSGNASPAFTIQTNLSSVAGQSEDHELSESTASSIISNATMPIATAPEISSSSSDSVSTYSLQSPLSSLLRIPSFAFAFIHM